MVETSHAEEQEFNPYILEVLQQQKWTRPNNMYDRTLLKDAVKHNVFIHYTSLRNGVDDNMHGLFTLKLRVRGESIIEFRPRHGIRTIEELSTSEVAMAVT